MEYGKFSKRDLMDILDVIQDCTRSKTEMDILNITSRLKEMLCADNAVCALGDASTGKIVKLVNLNYPAEWAGIYMGEEFYRIDPVIRFNYEFYKTHMWGEAQRIFTDQPYIDLMNRASDFGLNYGVASGVNGTGYKGSIFSFSCRDNRFKEHHKNLIDILTPHIHQALVRICELAKKPDAQLSVREKEVLVWMKEGKTNWEISAILNIAERTVKFHVQNIERKLNAVNKAHAIAIAMDTGLVM